MPKPLSCPEICNILLIGGGGREHALAWKLKQSPRLGKLWLTNPENAGLAEIGEVCPVPILLKDPFRMNRWCDNSSINLVVVGPEVPLAGGIADQLQIGNRLVFGPKKAGALIESDKAFAKEMMRSASVPAAESRTFTDYEAACTYVSARDEGMVVKASGLAAGKGVLVCETQEETLDAVKRIMKDKEFGDAGNTILVEERLTGQEVSILALTDGKTIWVLDSCQDHKQVGEGDTGPNTGGMGAYSPTPLIDEAMQARIEREILVPTIDALKREGADYRGVLYAGLMLTHAGPRVLEFNCRFGDPECQPLMTRLRGDLVEILWSTASGNLDKVKIEFDPRTACTVVICSEGYPGLYKKGIKIEGIADAESCGDIVVFHSGTKRDEDGNVVTNGGRVLAVTALAEDLQSARDLATQAAEKISFNGAFFRRDIGNRVLYDSAFPA